MTPKEKAKELVDKIRTGLWRDRAVSIYSEDAIYCALIAVDEIINVINECGTEYYDNFWQEVKQEIENL